MEDLAAIAELLQMLVTDPGTGALIALLAAAAVIDCRTMRIPNWLTVSGMVYGLLYNATHATSTTAGLATAAGGAVTGLALFLPLYLIRVLGAGDVKLMVAIGAFLGALATLKAAVFVFVAGGIAALAFAASRRALGRMAHNLRAAVEGMLLPAAGGWRAAAAMPSVGKLPYGLSICAGTLTFLVARQLGFL